MSLASPTGPDPWRPPHWKQPPVWTAGILGILLLFTSTCADAGAESIRHWRTPIGGAAAAALLRFDVGDTVEIVARRYQSLSPHWSLPPPSYLTTPHPAAPALRYRRSIAFAALSRPHTYERPRLIRALYGADQVAGTAAALGGLGMVGGLWGEKTAAYFMGAGAVLGALWGGTLGADNPSIRIGVEPDPLGPDYGRRAHEIPVKRR